MSALVQALVLAPVQETSRWPEYRSLPARRADVCAGQIYRWRQELCHAGGGFSEVVIAAIDDSGNDRAALRPGSAIEVEFAGAARVRIPALTSPELAAAVVRALRR